MDEPILDESTTVIVEASKLRVATSAVVGAFIFGVGIFFGMGLQAKSSDCSCETK